MFRKLLWPALIGVFSFNAHASEVIDNTPIHSNQITVPEVTIRPELPGITISPGQPPEGVPASNPVLIGQRLGYNEAESLWQYSYQIFGQQINEHAALTIPYFSDQEISLLSGPSGWNLEIGNTDLFNLGQGVGYIRWSYDGVTPDSSNRVFSYYSHWSPGQASYNFVEADQTTSSGFLAQPLSPQAALAGITPLLLPVPVPIPSLALPLSVLLIGWVLSGSKQQARTAKVFV
ncbi:hypothetical protein ACQE3E_00850 [Methylomonas sp. MED-D]|uniref:hypothetical protein n=1 Tax=unclassified Methylomonas TaxID=2608980 RepID=UPI0028A4E5EE|nr:hypothetical protein [Methylomonas sp. MV1]MDT4330543.1 hypothetical protein [Methylomonas sp. MV1]